MKKTLFSIAFSFSTLLLTAQNWQEATIRADGQTVINGLEAQYQIVSCQLEDYVLIRFVNHNNFPVTASWTNAVYIKGSWNYASNSSSLTIQASQNTEGICQTENALLVPLKQFNLNDKPEHFSVSGLTVTKN